MSKNFKCKRCGRCCRPPRLYKEDTARIKKLGYNEDDFVYTDNLKNSYIRDKNGWCIFLKKSKESKTKCKTKSKSDSKSSKSRFKAFYASSCRIYPERPKICRIYPSKLRGENCRPIELAFDKYLKRFRTTP